MFLCNKRLTSYPTHDLSYGGSLYIDNLGHFIYCIHYEIFIDNCCFSIYSARRT